MHFVKLFVRSEFYFGAASRYILTRIKNTYGAFGDYEWMPWNLVLIWIVYVVEMAFCFFLSRIERYLGRIFEWTIFNNFKNRYN